LIPARSRRRTALRILGALLLAALAPACGGNSATRPADPHAPVLTPIEDVVLAENDTRSIPVTATDADGDSLAFSAAGLPAFARLESPSRDGAVLVLEPKLGDAGSYGPVSVKAADRSRADSTSFRITVAAATANPGALFYEPPSFCLADGAGPDTLTVYNLSQAALDWHPVHVPDGSVGLDADRVLSDRAALGLGFTWSPAGPYPAVDSLVALTNDPDRPRVSVPFRYEGPGAPADILPPDPPLLLYPGDGATFSIGDSFVAVWSDLSDCSGIDHYRFEIALTPDFRSPVAKANVTDSFVTVDVQPGDEGKAYWRVYAVDGAHLTGTPSAVRSWTVVP